MADMTEQEIEEAENTVIGMSSFLTAESSREYFEYSLAHATDSAKLDFVCREIYAVRQIANGVIPQLEAFSKNPLLKGLLKAF